MSRKNLSANKKIAGALAVSLAVVPFAGQAVQEKTEAKHDVALRGISENPSLVQPDKSFSLFVETKDKEYKKVEQQLKNQKFGVLIQSENKETIFLDANKGSVSYKNGEITVTNHPLFDRYTNYQAMVLVKSDYQKGLKGVFPELMTETLSFKTGSALHEPTKLTVNKTNASTSVLDNHEIELIATDDYGLPATGTAELALVEKGTRLADSAKVDKDVVSFVDGKASFKLNNKEAEQVDIVLTVSSEYNKRFIESTVSFEAGETEQLILENVNSTTVGKEATLAGIALDVYGNAVQDGVQIQAESERGEVLSDKTEEGAFELSYTPSRIKGNDKLNVKALDSNKEIVKSVYNKADNPSKLLPISLSEGNIDETIKLEFEVLDQYNNLVEDGEELMLDFNNQAMSSLVSQTQDGKVSFIFQPKESGDYHYTITGKGNPFSYKSETPVKIQSPEPEVPEELEEVTENGKNVLVVDPTGIQNAEGEAVTAEDVFTKAIEVAKPGDGIFLKAGDYTIESNDVFWKSPNKKYSNMIIRKNLTIIGEDPSNTTLIIDDSNSRHYSDGQHFGITFNAPNITLKNLTIKVNQEKTQSLWSVFNIWGKWDGSTSRGTTIENVRIETESPVPYLFYMNDYDINVKDVRVKSNGNIGHMFYWNYGNMNMSNSKFDMPMTSGYRSGTVKLDNTFFNVPSSELD